MYMYLSPLVSVVRMYIEVHTPRNKDHANLWGSHGMVWLLVLVCIRGQTGNGVRNEFDKNHMYECMRARERCC